MTLGYVCVKVVVFLHRWLVTNSGLLARRPVHTVSVQCVLVCSEDASHRACRSCQHGSVSEGGADHQGRFSEGVVVPFPVMPVDAVSEGGVVAYMLVAV